MFTDASNVPYYLKQILLREPNLTVEHYIGEWLVLT